MTVPLCSELAVLLSLCTAGLCSGPGSSTADRIEFIQKRRLKVFPRTRIEKDTCTPVFTEALFTIARTWKQPRCPSADKWITKLWYIYTMEYYSAIKKNTFESVLMRMKLEPIIQSEVSQKEKHQYSIPTHIYMEFRKMVTITLYTRQQKKH